MAKVAFLKRLLSNIFNCVDDPSPFVPFPHQVPRVIIELDDDGISTDVWKNYAQRFLEDGYTVLALTEPSNKWGAIGIGDGLWCYDTAGLQQYESFIEGMLKPGIDGFETLKECIDALPARSAICFNMDVFQWLEKLDQSERTLAVELLGMSDGPAIYGHDWSGTTLDATQIPKLVENLGINTWEGRTLFRRGSRNEKWFSACIAQFTPVPNGYLSNVKSDEWSVCFRHENKCLS